MSQIICQWLNDELRISKPVDPKTFAKDFASGFLIGEVLHRHELQDDFDQFAQSRAANSKLNNFSRMEPTFQLLGVPFDQNVAQAIMSEQHGAATRLLYQLYIVLQKKKNRGLSGIALEIMKPAATIKLQSVETDLYRDRLKNMVPRQTDINLQNVADQFEMKSKEMDEKMARLQYEQLRKVKKIQEELRIQDIEKLRMARRRQNEILARIQAAIVQIPKPTVDRTLKAIETRKSLRRKKEAEDVYTEITKFEKSHKKESPSSSIHSIDRSIQSEGISTVTSMMTTTLLKPDTTDEYIRNIQKRLEEDIVAREQREKRRRKILMEQLRAHEAQEEAYREEQLINRLMRQSQQERRIAVQLMHVRHEKEILWQNRVFLEKQYEERRLKEFQEALNREAILAQQAKLDNEEKTRKELILHEKMAAERAEARYRKHYVICQQIVDSIIDLVTKTGEYRELTNNLIPFQLMREWKELFFAGYSIYGEGSIDHLPSQPNLEQLVELEKLDLLDERGFEDYKDEEASKWTV
ncbi:sperm flagellar protein 2 isoform X2 [Rhinatrema bivittatum]|uniref:sperm flagellar protein 2 isoform X2 n=1 Tax=Rhinatrema bivittatum TaxID=194408 RepID=UPI00112634BB|nr:sperm flagellar protein 2 isoform X2 [Rhinatrema bivittatum]